VREQQGGKERLGNREPVVGETAGRKEGLDEEPARRERDG
jgi:hypothetical protein